MDRRTFVLAGAASLCTASVGAAAAEAAPIPVIDTHIHLWDLTRPQGAPYPPKVMNGVASREKMLPSVYKNELAPKEVVGAIAVDASSWVEDNLWLLEACATDTIMVGAVGNLQPNAKEFSEYIERYHRNPLYRGIRYGNIWGYDIVQQCTNPVFLNGLRLMAQAGLVLDVANPRMDLFRAALRVSDAVPDLPIVVEHLAGFVPPPEAAAEYAAVLLEFQQRPRIYGKISAFSISALDVPVSPKLSDHKARLDHLIGSFGEDRVMGGAFVSTKPDFALLKEYYSSKPRRVAEKFFWSNSLKIYNWVKRAPTQPSFA